MCVCVCASRCLSSLPGLPSPASRGTCNPEQQWSRSASSVGVVGHRLREGDRGREGGRERWMDGARREGGRKQVYRCACVNQELENRETLDSLLRPPLSFFCENCESFLFVVVNSQLKKNP